MDLNSFLSLLAQGLLIIAIPVVVAFLVQWLRQKGAEVRAHLTAQQQQFIDTGINFAVRAAEQAGLSNQVTGGGQAKKAYAVKAAQDYLDRLGIKLDVNMLTTLLEAEVNKQFSNAAPVVDDAATRSALLDKAVHTAVLAAEQSGLTGAIQNVAAQKKRYALDFAFKYLAEHGLRVDPTVVNGLIEAQVFAAKSAAQIQPTPKK
jgi:Bacteriophage holin of superfamily 6 (Holin_LLH)